MILLFGIALLATVFASCKSASTDPTASNAEGSSAAKIRVACLGDSITLGEGVALSDSYPSKMQDLLGNQYLVLNFGYSGAAVGAGADLPYVETEAYRQAMASAPDVVIIMLGTNDARHPNDTAAMLASFRDDYEALVLGFKDLATRPKVYLVTPIKVYGRTTAVDEAKLDRVIRPGIRKTAADLDLPLIDFSDLMRDNPKNYQKDGLHVSPAGYVLMSQALSRVLLGDS